VQNLGRQSRRAMDAIRKQEEKREERGTSRRKKDKSRNTTEQVAATGLGSRNGEGTNGRGAEGGGRKKRGSAKQNGERSWTCDIPLKGGEAGKRGARKNLSNMPSNAAPEGPRERRAKRLGGKNRKSLKKKPDFEDRFAGASAKISMNIR